MKLLSNTVYFFRRQRFVIVSTLDSQGKIHCSVKGTVGIEGEGKVYIIDLYRAETFNNLKRNPAITITAVDEHRFKGYSLKGKAKIVEREKIKSRFMEKWEAGVAERVSKRVIKNIKEDKKTERHPEVLFPQPQYLIEMKVEEVVDLTPGHLKKPAR
ncbi:MAG: pyridoxamine 5'-phosphate oxidase family protein [Candidatus Omnitrophica bacterium]|nr:pyridoxamine 5'-phosphate oxidase family protein [Candidatus Omnitrophota bacterium]